MTTTKKRPRTKTHRMTVHRVPLFDARALLASDLGTLLLLAAGALECTHPSGREWCEACGALRVYVAKGATKSVVARPTWAVDALAIVERLTRKAKQASPTRKSKRGESTKKNDKRAKSGT